MKFEEYKKIFKTWGYTLSNDPLFPHLGKYVAGRNDNMFGILQANTIKDLVNLIDVKHMVKFK